MRTLILSGYILKEPGKNPELDTPFVLPAGSAVIDLAEMIHKDFTKNFKYACIWGSAKFDGQRVQKDYVLRDRDIVEYHVKMSLRNYYCESDAVVIAERSVAISFCR